MTALEERIDVDLLRGRHAGLVGELEALVCAHPLRERLWSHLMRALYRCGRQAEALEAYQEARRLLVEELGVEPRRELRDLQQAILRHDPSLDLVADVSTAESARGVFVGRERELEQLSMGLDDAFAGVEASSYSWESLALARAGSRTSWPVGRRHEGHAW